MMAKALVFVDGIASCSWGEFEVICLPYESDNRKWAATWKIEGEWSTLSYHATEAEARAACQAEFERIWREMTDDEPASPWRPMSEAPHGVVVLCVNAAGTVFTAVKTPGDWCDSSGQWRDPVAWMPIPPYEVKP